MKTIHELGILFVLTVLASSLSIGVRAGERGAAYSDTPTAEANAAYEAKDWARAAKLYQELSKERTCRRGCGCGWGVAEIAGEI